jgi:hypothetical protein
MSLVKISFLEILKKQYLFKLRSYRQVYISLVTLQLLAIVFSFNGSGMSGSGSQTLEVSVHYYSADVVVVFTMLWAFITSIIITTRAYRNDDFAFVANRISSNLANGLFLLTASIAGGITAMLSTSMLRVVMYVFGTKEFEVSTSSFSELFNGYIAAILYVLLFSALGYLIGTLVQLNRAFVVIAPAIFIAIFFVGAGNASNTIGVIVAEFFFNESSILLFVFKVMISAILLFSSSFVLSNQLEVRE